MEMYLAGVSVRRVEGITEALWGTRVSSGTVSRLNQKIYRHIEAWRNRKIEGEFPYLFLDGVVLKRSWAGEVRNVSVLVAIGVGANGHRQILGVAEGQKKDLEGWRGFLRHLKDRGLAGVQLIISDACIGLVESRRRTLSRRAMALRCISIATCSATCRRARSATWPYAESHPRPGRASLGGEQDRRGHREAPRAPFSEGGRTR